MNKSLNKEMLYMLYVEEKMSDQEIAFKYNEKQNEIKKLRKKWNININQRFLADLDEIEKMYKKFKYKKETEEILQEYVGIPRTSDLYIPILEILKDKNPHNIEEMWKISNKNYEIKEKEIPICGDTRNPTLYYRINWCIYKMLKNKEIQNKEKRKYIITEKGLQKLNKERDKEKPEKIKESEEVKIDPNEQYKKLEEIKEEIKIKQKRNQKEKSKSEKSKKVSKIDFEKINKEKIDLGKFCEHMVYLKERERIIREGREDLLHNIIWVSEKEGDGAGYDIKSIKKIGEDYEPIYIEVKGTNRNKLNHFYVTINELRASWEYKEKYYICQIINAKKSNPQFKYTQGAIDKNFKLDAIQYEASSEEE